MSPNQQFISMEALMRWAVHVLLVLAVTIVLPSSARAQETETVVYFHTDAIGSVRLITDANGQEVERFDHAPFGEPWPAPSPTEGPRFAWSEHDPVTGLNYLSARDLFSSTGRFTAVDPGHVGGHLGDPQSWNGYAYARNNPLRFIDPFGTDFRIFDTGGAGDGSFIFEGDFVDFKNYLNAQGGFYVNGNMFGGLILNANGAQAGRYSEWTEINELALGIRRGAGPIVDVVNIAAGVANIGLSVAFPIASTIANCIAGCAASDAAMAMAPFGRFWKTLKPFRGKIRTNGLSGSGRRYYQRDFTHGDLEVYDSRGRHLGSADSETGALTKPPVPGRKLRL